VSRSGDNSTICTSLASRTPAVCGRPVGQINDLSHYLILKTGTIPLSKFFNTCAG
jgi:hypothetical protein